MAGKTGVKRIWSALFYSLDGLAAAFKHEDAFRIEVLLALILIPLALFLMKLQSSPPHLLHQMRELLTKRAFPLQMAW